MWIGVRFGVLWLLLWVGMNLDEVRAGRCERKIGKKLTHFSYGHGEEFYECHGQTEE